MARNRKYQPAAIRFGPALKAALLCLLLGGFGVGYVWQKDQIVELGRQIQQREARLRLLGQQNQRLEKQLAELRLPQHLQKRIEDLKLGLAAPLQVWFLPEPPKGTQNPELRVQGPAGRQNEDSRVQGSGARQAGTGNVSQGRPAYAAANR